MAGSVSIRPARPEEYDAVESVMREALTDAEAYFPDLAGDGDPTLTPAYYEPPAGALFVAICDEVVGTVGIRPPDELLELKLGRDDGRVGELKRLHVRPSVQRRGIGRQLLDRAERAARERGYTALAFTTTSIQTAAHAFYEAAGYTRFDREPFDHEAMDAELWYYRRSL